MQLDDLRREIDTINEQLLLLFERRMAISREVAAYKLEHGMEVLVPAREAVILNWAEQRADPELKEYTLRFFESILAESRSYQSKQIAKAETDGK